MKTYTFYVRNVENGVQVLPEGPKGRFVPDPHGDWQKLLVTAAEDVDPRELRRDVARSDLNAERFCEGRYVRRVVRLRMEPRTKEFWALLMSWAVRGFMVERADKGELLEVDTATRAVSYEWDHLEERLCDEAEIEDL